MRPPGRNPAASDYSRTRPPPPWDAHRVCISIPMLVPSDVPLGLIRPFSGESLESSKAGICA
jgi:hypothetical protein